MNDARTARARLLLAAILFTLGLIGLLTRRDLIFTLMSLEVMLNASGLAFVVAGLAWGQADGQIVFLFILAMAAAEVSVDWPGAAVLPPSRRSTATLRTR